MDKKTFIIKVATIACGVIGGALILFIAWTLHQDHKTLKEVVTFLNQQIKASQENQPIK